MWSLVGFETWVFESLNSPTQPARYSTEPRRLYGEKTHLETLKSPEKFFPAANFFTVFWDLTMRNAPFKKIFFHKWRRIGSTDRQADIMWAIAWFPFGKSAKKIYQKDSLVGSFLDENFLNQQKTRWFCQFRINLHKNSIYYHENRRMKSVGQLDPIKENFQILQNFSGIGSWSFSSW